MRNFELIATGVDVAPIIAALDAMPELWDEITIRQDHPGSAHHDTDCIFLRGPRAFTVEDYLYDLGAYDYPAMDKLASVLVPVLRPLLQDALRVDELGRVLIVRLKPGGHIDPHVDEGDYADHYSRFHLALTGDACSTLTAGGETQHFAPGELWWFDHKAEHTAANASDQPRIHIIIDAVTPLFPMPRGAGTS
jgi:hypothetical protein